MYVLECQYIVVMSDRLQNWEFTITNIAGSSKQLLEISIRIMTHLNKSDVWLGSMRRPTPDFWLVGATVEVINSHLPISGEVSTSTQTHKGGHWQSDPSQMVRVGSSVGGDTS